MIKITFKKLSEPWTLEDWRRSFFIVLFWSLILIGIWAVELRAKVKCYEHMWFVHAMAEPIKQERVIP